MNGDSLVGEITDLELFLDAHATDRCVHVLAALFQHDTAGARAALEPLLVESPHSQRLLALEADIWRDEGRFDEAADRYRRLIRGSTQPLQQATLTQHLGTVHFVAGQFADAAECFGRALALREEHGADGDLVASSRRALERAEDDRPARPGERMTEGAWHPPSSRMPPWLSHVGPRQPGHAPLVSRRRLRPGGGVR